MPIYVLQLSRVVIRMVCQRIGVRRESEKEVRRWSSAGRRPHVTDAKPLPANERAVGTVAVSLIR